MKLTRYGIREIVVAFLLLAAICAAIVWGATRLGDWFAALVLLPVIVFAWVVSFFRDPEREVPTGDKLLLSPADGVVTHIDEVDEPSFIGGRARRISIFMSIFNVHVNRAPFPGAVEHLAYRKGDFLNAMRADSWHLNEANDMGLETGRPDLPRLLVRQIAGAIARRIVCDRKVGDRLARGERFGMIKFSSRVEVYLPAGAEVRILAKVGDAVRAGETVLGEVA